MNPTIVLLGVLLAIACYFICYLSTELQDLRSELPDLKEELPAAKAVMGNLDKRLERIESRLNELNTKIGGPNSTPEPWWNVPFPTVSAEQRAAEQQVIKANAVPAKDISASKPSCRNCEYWEPTEPGTPLGNCRNPKGALIKTVPHYLCQHFTHSRHR